MTTSAPRHSPWFSLLREEHGFSGAQKALAILLALGLILMVTRSITGGTTVASVNSKAMLDEQDGNAAVVWSEQAGGGSLSGASGSGAAAGGSDSSGSAGDGDSGGGFWSTVGHVVLGVGTVVAIFVAPEIVIPLMIADGILYTAEGDYVNAGISFLGPVAEGIKIIQGGIKVVQGGEEVVKIIQTGEEIVESVNAERNILQKGRAVEELATSEAGIAQVEEDLARASDPVGRRGSPLEIQPGTNKPATVNGIDYSGHALDRMQGRGYTPSVIENAIKTGERTVGNKPGTWKYFDPVNNVKVITNSETGRVITVF